MPLSLSDPLIAALRTSETAALIAVLVAKASWNGVMDQARAVLEALGAKPEASGRPTEAEGPLPTPKAAKPAHGPRRTSARGVSVAERQRRTDERDKAIVEFVMARPEGARLKDILHAMRPAAVGTVRSALERLGDRLERDDAGFWRAAQPATPCEPWIEPLSGAKAAREAHLTAA
jgi:hypothetical protein